jgi:hypothetical protein
VGGLPATAVQALYHAATGKTENLTKQLSKNFIIRESDLNQLYFKIMQQLEHFERVAGPTVTIKVQFDNRESQQFSSWVGFKLSDSGKTEIVSNVVLKFEFVIKLPEVPVPQRYVVNIDLFSRFGNLGAAAFITLYAYLKGGDLGGPIQIAYLGSIAIVVWTLSSLLCGHIGALFGSLILRSFVPASVLLTTGDERAFKKVQDRARAATPKLVGYLLTTSGTLLLNVLASFLYAWITR